MSSVKLTTTGGNGGTLELKAPANTTSNAAVQLTLPVDDGAANTFLKSNGSGVTSWAGPTATEIATTSGTASASTYLCGNNTWATPSGGKILQVLSTTKEDAWSQTTSGANLYNAMSLNITTTGANNKVLVTCHFTGDCGGNYNAIAAVLRRGTTILYRGEERGNRTRAGAMLGLSSDDIRTEVSTLQFLDTPGSAATHSYHLSVFDGDENGGIAYLNMARNDSNDAHYITTASTLTLMEVSA